MRFYTSEVLKDIPSKVTVVAATKYFDSDEMRELYHTGINHFGENRVEALLEKYDSLQDLPITWHFIGTLQTKKAKKVVAPVIVIQEAKVVEEPVVEAVVEPVVEAVVEPAVKKVAPKSTDKDAVVENYEEEVFEEFEEFDEDKYNEYMDTYEDQYKDKK
jgi:hypothetical protein